MSQTNLRLTSVGGPALIVEIGGLRLITDPTVDSAGTDYPAKVYTLHKLTDPAIIWCQPWSRPPHNPGYPSMVLIFLLGCSVP